MAPRLSKTDRPPGSTAAAVERALAGPHLGLEETRFLGWQNLFSPLTKTSDIWEGRILPVTKKATSAGWRQVQSLGSKATLCEGGPQSTGHLSPQQGPGDLAPLSVEVAAWMRLRLHQQVSLQAALHLTSTKYKHHHSGHRKKGKEKVRNRVMAHSNLCQF